MLEKNKNRSQKGDVILIFKNVGKNGARKFSDICQNLNIEFFLHNYKYVPTLVWHCLSYYQADLKELKNKFKEKKIIRL